MARTAAEGFWSQVRALSRGVRRWHDGFRRGRLLAAALVVSGLSFATPCRAADAVKGEATFSAAKGYARLVLKLAEDVPSEVVTAGSIVVIRFERPVDIPVDRLSDAVPDYVSSARRDPDGTAIRLSLARRVAINTMSAGERTFVDFLPDSWVGPPPSARCASSAPMRSPGSVRRSACARWCSRPSSASCSRCPTAWVHRAC